MLKKLLKGCLTIAIATAMAVPAMAIDAKVTGRVRGYLKSSNVKDGRALTEFEADGRFGGKITGETDSGWVGVGALEFSVDPDTDPDDVQDSVKHRHNYIGVSNEMIDVKIGRQYPYGVAQGMSYMVGPGWMSWWAGEGPDYNYNGGYGDMLTVGITQVGVTAIIGMDNINDANEADATGDQYLLTTFGVVFSKSFGPVDVGATYIVQSTSIDDEYSGDAVKKTTYDGSSLSDFAFGVKFNITDLIGVALNYDMTTFQSGVNNADPEATMNYELWGDIGFAEGMGVSVGYGNWSTNDGTDNNTVKTFINVGFSAKVDVAKLFVTYKATTEVDDDTNKDAAESLIVFGGQVGF
ncbi:porin [bacterium]|nr:porin [bacterium]